MKKWLSCILSILLLLSLSPAVSAASDAPKVVDQAGLLTESEEEALTQTILGHIDTYGMDIVILTVPGLDGRSAQAYADDYYDRNGYGIGSDGSGILLLLAMEERQWYMSTCGEAMMVFSDDGLDALGEEILPYLSGGSYYEAFTCWVDLLPEYFEVYRSGETVGDPSGPTVTTHGKRTYSVNIWVSLLIGLAAAVITILIMRSGMNTIRRQSGAGDYVTEGSYHLTVHQDIFLYSNITKTPKPKNNSSSGGRSHGGRGGSF